MVGPTERKSTHAAAAPVRSLRHPKFSTRLPTSRGGRGAAGDEEEGARDGPTRRRSRRGGCRGWHHLHLHLPDSALGWIENKTHAPLLLARRLLCLDAVGPAKIREPAAATSPPHSLRPRATREPRYGFDSAGVEHLTRRPPFGLLQLTRGRLLQFAATTLPRAGFRLTGRAMAPAPRFRPAYGAAMAEAAAEQARRASPRPAGKESATPSLDLQERAPGDEESMSPSFTATLQMSSSRRLGMGRLGGAPRGVGGGGGSRGRRLIPGRRFPSADR
ncbi:unnamed protein product [Urochloa humidicola]